MSEFPSGEQRLWFLTYMMSRIGLKTSPASCPVFKECNVTDTVPQCVGRKFVYSAYPEPAAYHRKSDPLHLKSGRKPD